MTLGSINYVSLYFKYKTPTLIREIPTHKALRRLKTEFQTNASSIEIDLEGSDHRYLDLILTDKEYAAVPNTQPFIPPLYQGNLTIPATVTAIEALQLKDEYIE